MSVNNGNREGYLHRVPALPAVQNSSSAAKQQCLIGHEMAVLAVAGIAVVGVLSVVAYRWWKNTMGADDDDIEVRHTHMSAASLSQDLKVGSVQPCTYKLQSAYEQVLALYSAAV